MADPNSPGPLAHYPFPRLQALTLGIHILVCGGRRSFAAEGARAIRTLPLQPRVAGLEHVPATGPFVLVSNHYERPGLWTFWGVLLISAAVARRRRERPDIRWLITAETRGTRYGGVPVPAVVMQWAIGRVARGYGLLALPLAPEETGARAATLRSALTILRRGDKSSQVVGVLPEGTGSRALREALPGTGEFLLLAARSGAPIVPVGLAERPEHNWALTATFGEPFELSVPREAPRQERDRLARMAVMVRVGRLLPPNQWGFYREAIAKTE